MDQNREQVQLDTTSIERPPDLIPLAEIGCRSRQAGLPKHHYRKAA